MGISTNTWLAVTALIVSIYISRCDAQDRPCNANDKKALLEFKAGFITYGYEWTTWDPDTNCCGWVGVVCTRAGRVQLLTVPNYWGRNGPVYLAERKPSYKGVVGSTLGDLSELRNLDLSMILFNGPMPNIFDKLQKLEELTFFYNNFSGSLPPSIGMATSLNSLKVDGNGYRLSFPNVLPAEIPSSFCQLKNLTTLSIGYFKLNGKVPECFCKFDQLKDLELNDNELEGGIPSCLGSAMRNLQKLVLSGNRLAGDIPASVGRRTSLKSLDLHDNKLSGSIPKEIGKLVHLQSLILGQNSLSGPIPGTIGNLAELTLLDFDFNSLTHIPPEMGKLAKVNYLSVRNNQLEGSLPPEIGNCGSEGTGVYLDISNNRLSGPIPDVFGSGHFDLLFASNNQFTGGFPLSLAMVGDVDVTYNQLSDLKPVGTLPPSPKIYYLRLANNLFSGPLPSWLENLVVSATDLSNLDLQCNKFTGSVPAYWFSMSYSYGVNLNASHNSLAGHLPSISSSTVSDLDLSHNSISGPISSEFFGGLLNMTYNLDLSFNKLSGPLPENSGDFQHLYHLDLSYNELTGKVPEAIEKIPSLHYLNLSHNNFTGRVPSIPPSNPLHMSS